MLLASRKRVSVAPWRLLERGGQPREIVVRSGFRSAMLLAYMRWALKDGLSDVSICLNAVNEFARRLLRSDFSCAMLFA